MICLSAVPSMSNEALVSSRCLCVLFHTRNAGQISEPPNRLNSPPKSVYLPYAKAKDSFELDFIPCLHRSQSSDSGVQWALSIISNRGCSQNIRGTIK